MSRSRLSSVIVFLSTSFLFVDSWHRHGPYTFAYAVLLTLASLLVLAAMLLSKEK
jgi:hypothetical protein